MPYRRVFLFVEGYDDVRFVDHILRPVLERAFDYVQTIEYACLTKKKVLSLLRGAEQIPDAEYFFFADNDGSTCITGRKAALRRHHPLQDERVLVVVEEIESWYLAGLTPARRAALDIKAPARLTAATKEDFDACVMRRNDLRADRLEAILAAFDLARARSTNVSFDYAARRLNL